MLLQLETALGMFIFLMLELSLLFMGISLLVGVLQRHIPAAKLEELLSSNKIRSYFVAVGLGAITPFCSCSTLPMLKGLIRARAGFGPMMVFLFSSPLLNPIIVGLLIVTFGLPLTAIYVLTATLVALASGWLLYSLRFERYLLNRQANKNKQSLACSSTEKETSCCNQNNQDLAANKNKERYKGVAKEAWTDFIAVLPYLVVGIAIGSLIYGFIPTELLKSYAGSNNLFAIPIAAVIGVPLYIRAEAVIPLAGALMAKGVSAGAVLAFIIGSAGASLTELILLRALFATRLLIAFLVVIFSMAILAGYIAYLFY